MISKIELIEKMQEKLVLVNKTQPNLRGDYKEIFGRAIDLLDRMTAKDALEVLYDEMDTRFDGLPMSGEHASPRAIYNEATDMIERLIHSQKKAQKNAMIEEE